MACVDSYFSVAETGNCVIGSNSFLTAITEAEQVKTYVDDCLSSLGLDKRVIDSGWHEDGWVVTFASPQDRAMFALAFKGPRM